MVSPCTQIRALVPYQAPKNGVVNLAKGILRRLFSAVDRLFLARRRAYFFLMLLICFGILLGSFCPFSGPFSESELRTILRFHCYVLFLGSLTLLGVVVLPACFFLSSCAIGVYLLRDGASVWLFFFLFFFLLLGAECLDTWTRGRSGWKTLVIHRDFLLLCSFFLISLFLL